jgi:hypothetical protein
VRKFLVFRNQFDFAWTILYIVLAIMLATAKINVKDLNLLYLSLLVYF